MDQGLEFIERVMKDPVLGGLIGDYERTEPVVNDDVDSVCSDDAIPEESSPRPYDDTDGQNRSCSQAQTHVTPFFDAPMAASFNETAHTSSTMTTDRQSGTARARADENDEWIRSMGRSIRSLLASPIPDAGRGLDDTRGWMENTGGFDGEAVWHGGAVARRDDGNVLGSMVSPMKATPVPTPTPGRVQRSAVSTAERVERIKEREATRKADEEARAAFEEELIAKTNAQIAQLDELVEKKNKEISRMAAVAAEAEAKARRAADEIASLEARLAAATRPTPRPDSPSESPGVKRLLRDLESGKVKDLDTFLAMGMQMVRDEGLVDQYKKGINRGG